MTRTDWTRTPENLATLLIDHRRVAIAVVLSLVVATSAGVIFLEEESGFGVLALAIHPPLQQFGIITAIMIGYAFVGAVFVLPSLLVPWARYSESEPAPD